MSRNHFGAAWLVAALVAGAAPAAAGAQTTQDDVTARAERMADGFAERMAQARDRAAETADRVREQAEREMDLYENGQDAIEESRWSEAIARFQSVIDLAGQRVDAALYWKAYALDKSGERAEALAAITEIADRFPKSRWLGDAKALEIQVRRNAGQPVRPENEADEELKLLAIQSLQFREPDQAIPLLKGILEGPQSVKLKERALFVLAQSRSDEARQMLADFAKGASNPDLQRRAIDYLGVHGSADNRKLLGDIYAQSADVALKRRILRAFMVSGDRPRVLTAATGEASPELRAEAVRLLGVMGAHDELWQLYQKETDVDVKKRMLQAMFIGGNADRLLDLARTEQNRELRLTAVKNLGLLGRAKSSEGLVAIYTREEDADFKRAAVQALFVQGNAEALVALARKETNLDMKKVLVQRLSLMKDKVAIDYLMELLK